VLNRVKAAAVHAWTAGIPPLLKHDASLAVVTHAGSLVGSALSKLLYGTNLMYPIALSGSLRLIDSMRLVFRPRDVNGFSSVCICP